MLRFALSPSMRAASFASLGRSVLSLPAILAPDLKPLSSSSPFPGTADGRNGLVPLRPYLLSAASF